MKDNVQLTQLFRYEAWANRMMADALNSHPAQIASQLSAAGTTPPATGFLYYLREVNSN